MLRVVLRAPDDFHVHFRQGDDLPAYVRASAAWCARALVMPNTLPAVQNAEDALRYRDEILRAAESGSQSATQKYPAKNSAQNSQKNSSAFTPLMTCKLYEAHTPRDIAAMKRAGITACKLYPRGATTNAQDGVSEVRALEAVYKEMEAQGLVLCVHGERPQSFVLDREKDFLPALDEIRRIAPSLRVVLEHVSSAEAVSYVQADASGLLAATVTVHHLLYTLDELLGDHVNPHFFCKPVLKTPRDLRAIQAAVVSRSPKFFLGTDSAPHRVDKKECAAGCAGVYSAPVALPLLAQFFVDAFGDEARGGGQPNILRTDKTPWVDALEHFTSEYGAQFYGLERNRGTVALVKHEWEVPRVTDGVVPLCAGKKLAWRVEPQAD